MDHILFLLALAAIYRFRDWRAALWVVTAFTVGHSITLALAVTGVLTISPSLVEFLIPVTIVITAVENSSCATAAARCWNGRYRPVFAGVFGLVHGAGFASYLKSLFVDHVALPLFGFNVGIELGQIVVLARGLHGALLHRPRDRVAQAPAERAGAAAPARARGVVARCGRGGALGDRARAVVMLGRGVGARWLAIALSLCVARSQPFPARPSAHPLHTTLVQLTYDERTRVLEGSIRVFAGDFAAAVAKRAGRQDARRRSRDRCGGLYVREQHLSPLGCVPVIRCRSMVWLAPRERPALALRARVMQRAERARALRSDALRAVRRSDQHCPDDGGSEAHEHALHEGDGAKSAM